MKQKIGHITIITGPMFAGKTTALITKYKLLSINLSRPCLVFKPKRDTRYSSNEIVSHNGKKIEAVLIENLAEINLIHLKDKPEIKDIIIDELQFFATDTYQHLEELAENGINIIAAGLDWNYFADKPFEITINCLAIADKVIKLTAKCDYKYLENVIDDRECNNPATKYYLKVSQITTNPRRLCWWCRKISECLSSTLPITTRNQITYEIRHIVFNLLTFLPCFFTFTNYFTVLNPEQRTSAVGIVFLVVSILYFLGCLYFLIIN